MDANDAISLLGVKNPFIIKWYVILGFTKNIPAAFSLFAFFFASMKPIDFHCRLPPNITKEQAIPKEFVAGQWRFSQCRQFANVTDNSSQVSCVNGYSYTETLVQTSTVMEWDLVCDRAIWNEVATSSFFITSIIGALVCGMLSDKYGRRPVFLVLLMTLSILIFLHTFMPNVYLFIVLRLFTGSAQQGMFVAGFCLALELFPVSYRSVIGIFDNYFWTCACFILVGIAYFVRNWRYFFLATSLPFLFFIPLYFYLPESIPWLVSKGELDKAKDILKLAAKSGKVKIDDKEFEPLSNLPANRRRRLSSASRRRSLNPEFALLSQQKGQSKNESDQFKDTDYSVVLLFKHGTLRRWTFANIIIWFTTAMTVYGIQVKAMDLGDPYINFSLTSAIEIPAYLVAMPIIKRFGRKFPQSIMFILTGISLVIGYVFSEFIKSSSWPAIIVLLIGRLIVSAIFSIIFLYTAEMYPTPLRSTSIGMCTGAARIGVSVAPFVFFLERYHSSIPYAVLIMLCFIAAFLTLCFPETVHRSLPDRIEEIEAWVKNKPWIHVIPRKAEVIDDQQL